MGQSKKSIDTKQANFGAVPICLLPGTSAKQYTYGDLAQTSTVTGQCFQIDGPKIIMPTSKCVDEGECSSSVRSLPVSNEFR